MYRSLAGAVELELIPPDDGGDPPNTALQDPSSIDWNAHSLTSAVPAGAPTHSNRGCWLAETPSPFSREAM